MPNTDLTQILVIQDRSGSMLHLRQATIDGFNEFINGQRATPGLTRVRLIQFDHEYITRFDSLVMDVQPLTNASYEPRGNTALLDAMGRAIKDLGEDLKRMPDADRPGKVIVVIMTDGEENASSQYTRDQVFAMVKHQTEAYQWQFLYLGANQDAINEGAKLGMNRGQTMTYAANSGSTRASYMHVNSAVNRMKGGNFAGFTEDERKAALQDDDADKKTT